MAAKRVFLQLATSAAILGGNVVLAYGVSALLARLLGLHGFGVYSLVIATVTMLTAPAFFGLPTLISREIAAGTAAGDFGLVAGLIRRAHQFIFVMAAVMIVGAGLFALVTGKADLALLWGLPLILLMSLAAARSAMLRGVGKVIQGQWPEQLLRPALLVALALAVVGAGRRLDPATAVALTAAAAVLALGISLVQWTRAKPLGLADAAARYQDRAWLTAVIPFALSTGVLVVSAQVGMVILGAMRPAAEVAIFRGATQTAQLAALGYTAVIMNISPRLAAAAACGDRAGMATAAWQGAAFSTAFSAPVALVMALGAAPLLGLLFGQEFAVGGMVLAIMAGGQVMNSAFGCGAALLNMSGHERDVTLALGGGLIVQAAGTFALVPSMGAAGAAIAAVCAIAASNFALQRLAILRLGINPAVWAPLTDRKTAS